MSFLLPFQLLELIFGRQATQDAITTVLDTARGEYARDVEKPFEQRVLESLLTTVPLAVGLGGLSWVVRQWKTEHKIIENYTNQPPPTIQERLGFTRTKRNKGTDKVLKGIGTTVVGGALLALLYATRYLPIGQPRPQMPGAPPPFRPLRGSPFGPPIANGGLPPAPPPDGGNGSGRPPFGPYPV